MSKESLEIYRLENTGDVYPLWLHLAHLFFFQTCIIAKHLYLVLLRYNFPLKSCHTVTKDVTWKSIEMFLLLKTAQMNRIHSVRTTDH